MGSPTVVTNNNTIRNAQQQQQQQHYYDDDKNDKLEQQETAVVSSRLPGVQLQLNSFDEVQELEETSQSTTWWRNNCVIILKFMITSITRTVREGGEVGNNSRFAATGEVWLKTG